MNSPRWDETWHRLREWTNSQAQSERLAGQILISDGYGSLDPSHPLGGRDGGIDALCFKERKKYLMAVYFPRGQKGFKEVKKKFDSDISKAKQQAVEGFAFITNQELTLSERKSLLFNPEFSNIEIYHLERITSILDDPKMLSIRKQFLGIDYSDTDIARSISTLDQTLKASIERLEGMQTGGTTFCYLMLYHFDMHSSIAKNLVVIRMGEYPLYDIRLRIIDMEDNAEIFSKFWGEMSAPAEFNMVKWKLKNEIYYRIFFHARNGQWHQDLVLNRSDKAECWLASTIVFDTNGRDIVYRHIDNEFLLEFGEVSWRT
jgi:hypothetical protein